MARPVTPQPRGAGYAGAQPLCVPKPSIEKAARCFLSSSRIFSSSESGSRGLLYSSSSVSEVARSPPEPPARCEDEEGSRALFFLHLVRRFWNQTCCPMGPAQLAAITLRNPCHTGTNTHLHLRLSHTKRIGQSCSFRTCQVLGLLKSLLQRKDLVSREGWARVLLLMDAVSQVSRGYRRGREKWVSSWQPTTLDSSPLVHTHQPSVTKESLHTCSPPN